MEWSRSIVRCCQRTIELFGIRSRRAVVLYLFVLDFDKVCRLRHQYSLSCCGDAACARKQHRHEDTNKHEPVDVSVYIALFWTLAGHIQWNLALVDLNIILRNLPNSGAPANKLVSVISRCRYRNGFKQVEAAITASRSPTAHITTPFLSSSSAFQRSSSNCRGAATLSSLSRSVPTLFSCEFSCMYDV